MGRKAWATPILAAALAAPIPCEAVTVVREAKAPAPAGEVFLKTAQPGRGGPDEWGYVYSDSSQQDGPSFSWVDISATGTDLGLSDDSSSDRFPIGFTFPFYAQEYTEVNVASNGVVYFGTDTYLGLSNICLPSETGYGTDTNALIAAYWDDLAPGTDTGGRVLAQVLGEEPERRLVIMWDQVPVYGKQQPLSFEVILNEIDGSIVLQYLEVNEGEDAGGSATIGIQDPSAGAGCGLEYSCNAANLENGLAIRFVRAAAARQAVPSLGSAGISVLVLLLLAAGTLILRRESSP